MTTDVIAVEPQTDNTTEVLAGLVERVTFHSAESGFCVLRVKARGHPRQEARRAGQAEDGRGDRCEEYFGAAALVKAG